MDEEIIIVDPTSTPGQELEVTESVVVETLNDLPAEVPQLVGFGFMAGVLIMGLIFAIRAAVGLFVRTVR